MAGKSSRPEIYRRANEANSANASGHLRFPNKPYPHTMLLVFKEYDYSGFKRSNGNQSRYENFNLAALDTTGRSSGAIGLRSGRAIELPFPKQLQDQTGLIINGFSRDPATETLAGAATDFINGAGSVADIPSIIQNIGAKAAEKLASSSSGIDVSKINLDDTASSVSYLLRSLIGGDVAKSVDLATGQTVNPRETLAFEGVQLKQHQFSWDLYPSNRDDTEMIQKIIKLMKQSVLPVTQDFGGIAKAFLRYPHTCEIYLLGIDREYFMKFKPCLVTNLTVDYGAGGNLAIMKGGVPAGVNISISLQEMQIETADDWGAVSNESGSVSKSENPVYDDQALRDLRK